NEGRLIMMTSSVASECFIVTGSHASRELEIVLSRGVGRAPQSASSWPGPPLQASPRAGGGTGLQRRQFKICIEKEPRARYTAKRSTRKRTLQSRLGPGAMSSIALQLSRCWTTSLVVLLVTPTSVVFGEDPSPTVGKYSCSVDNIVGLQTSSQTGTRFA